MVRNKFQTLKESMTAFRLKASIAQVTADSGGAQHSFNILLMQV